MIIGFRQNRRNSHYKGKKIRKNKKIEENRNTTKKTKKQADVKP
jgi:hypothetical protein